jgi:pimeloyl-ACP methyl ester carboxylesterase
MVEQLRPFGSLYACRMAARNLVPADQLETMMRLGEIICPTLIIWGSEDRIIAPGAARRFQQALPDATLQMFAECGHSPQLEDPANVARALQNWYDEPLGS